MADLFEFLIGTGMRKGEALGLHWVDVHLAKRVLYVRCTLSAIDNNHLVITTPKTRTSRNWVAVSPRVATALEHRARSRARRHSDPSVPFTGLVFCRPDGQPLRPHTILDRLRQLSKGAGVPRVTVHDLRHLAATITITAGVPLTVVSKTLRTTPCQPPPTCTATSPNKPPAKPSTTPSPGPRNETTDRPGWNGCDHHATTSSTSAKPSTGSAPPPAFSTIANQPGSGRAIILRPPAFWERKKTVLPRMRERPPTCINAGRDDRI